MRHLDINIEIKSCKERHPLLYTINGIFLITSFYLLLIILILDLTFKLVKP